MIIRVVGAMAALVTAGSSAKLLAQRAPTSCTVDSPERRGKPGCTILAQKPLPTSSRQPLFWHIDRFPSLAAAEAAAGGAGVAAEAHGAAWLMTVEMLTSDHHGGTHAALIGPLPLPNARSYEMMILSALFSPGDYTPVHQHSGPEIWYVIAGEQCLQTPERALKTKAGETAIVPAGVTMRLVATGTERRRALVLILHDAAQLPTSVINGSPLLANCK
jgi:quercetin dioxygenase-like cupin family protein